jgi:DNA (cytosine-5)-methyltransferase 1
LISDQKVAHALRGEGFDASEDGTGRGTPLVAENVSPPITNNPYGDHESREGLLVANSGAVSHTICASAQQSLDAETETLMAVQPISFNSREDPEVTGDRAGPLGASSPQAQAIAIQERAVSENPGAGPDGAGVREDGASYTLEARTTAQAVAFAQNTRDEVRLMGGDGSVVGSLSAQPGMKQTTYVAEPYTITERGRQGEPSLEHHS